MVVAATAGMAGVAGTSTGASFGATSGSSASSVVSSGCTATFVLMLGDSRRSCGCAGGTSVDNSAFVSRNRSNNSDRIKDFSSSLSSNSSEEDAEFFSVVKGLKGASWCPKCDSFCTSNDPSCETWKFSTCIPNKHPTRNIKADRALLFFVTPGELTLLRLKFGDRLDDVLAMFCLI